MSLINDALRKAQATQKAGGVTAHVPNPYARDPELRAQDSSVFTLPFLIAIVLVLTVVSIWGWNHGSNVELVVRANTRPTAISSETSPVSIPEIANAPAMVTPEPDATAKNETALIAESPAVSDAVVELPQPTGPIYRLQEILFLPRLATAVINGKIVHIGDRVDDARVVAIDGESVTIATPTGQTNVLSLAK